MDTKHARDTYLSLLVAIGIPLLQAVASGVLIGAAAAALFYLLELSAVVVLSLLVAAGVAALVWISGLRWWRAMVASIDGTFERIPLTHSYVEPDGYLMEPPSVRIELVQADGRSGSYIHLPVSPSKLVTLARGLADGASFTEAAWCGSGGIFTRGEFIKLREEMLRRGLLVLNSPSTPARGYRLSRGGEAAIRYLADTTHPLLESNSFDEY